MCSTATTSSDDLIALTTSDEQEFMVPRSIIRRSLLIESIIQKQKKKKNKCQEELIPLPDITAKTLRLVIEWCEHEVNSPILTERDKHKKTVLSDWAKVFLDIDQTRLYHLMTAANYLNIQCLLHASCQIVADMIKGKSTEQIRKIYNIKNDFTPEEEARMKRSIARRKF